MVLMSHNREASKVTIYKSYFHPAHQHYTDEAHKAETVPSVVIYIYIYIYIHIYIYMYIYFKNSLIIHEENTKKNHRRVVSLYVDKDFPSFT